MNMRELLNPAPPTQQRQQLLPDCAAVAAASLVLLGSQQIDGGGARNCAATGAGLNLSIRAAASSTCKADEGRCTPLSTAMPARTMATPAATVTSTSANPNTNASTSGPPHLSPVTDKLQHAALSALWSFGSADLRLPKPKRSALQLQQQQPQHDPLAKRLRLEGAATPLVTSRTNGLFQRAHERAAARSSPHSSSFVTHATGDAAGAASPSPSPSSSTDGRGSQPPSFSSASPPPVTATFRPAPSAVAAAAAAAEQFCVVAGCLRLIPAQSREVDKCATHRGLKLCGAGGCCRPVQSRGFCKSHGGGARCQHAGCTKGAISKGRCRAHGGGTRCAVPSCSKWAQRFGCCVRHSKAVAAAGLVDVSGANVRGAVVVTKRHARV